MAHKKKLLVSAENSEYQIIQALKQNRTKRSKSNEVFVEGTESIKQAISAGVTISRIIVAGEDELSSWAKDIINRNPQSQLIDMKFELYQKLCDKGTPAEMLVTLRIEPTLLCNLVLPAKPFIVVFDRPSDYGNFGSLIRSANSFDVDAIFVIGHGIDVYDPKVIRSSLGSIFHSKILSMQSMAEFQEWIVTQKQSNKMIIVGTDSLGNISLIDSKLCTPITLILGNEAKGMSIALKEVCDRIVRIPISGAVNSLNVSCAGSIFFWEIYRNST